MSRPSRSRSDPPVVSPRGRQPSTPNSRRAGGSGNNMMAWVAQLSDRSAAQAWRRGKCGRTPQVWQPLTSVTAGSPWAHLLQQHQAVMAATEKDEELKASRRRLHPTTVFAHASLPCTTPALASHARRGCRACAYARLYCGCMPVLSCPVARSLARAHVLSSRRRKRRSCRRCSACRTRSACCGGTCSRSSKRGSR